MASKIIMSGYVTVNDVELFYEREGDQSSKTILFVNGLGGTTNSFQSLVPDLQDYDLVRFDLSGQGRSGLASNTSIASFVEDCESVASHLELRDVVVVGHSLGGLIALHLAAKRPDLVTGLVLFGPVIPPPKPGQEALATRSAAVRKSGMAAVADTIVSNAFASESFTSRRTAVALAREMLTRQSPEGYASAAEALARSTFPDWKNIKSKVLVISGEEDKVSTGLTGELVVHSVGALATRLVWKGVGHWHILENTAGAVEAIKSFC